MKVQIEDCRVAWNNMCREIRNKSNTYLKYKNARDKELKKFNASFEGGLSLTFENESDYAWFLLTYS